MVRLTYDASYFDNTGMSRILISYYLYYNNPNKVFSRSLFNYLWQVAKAIEDLIEEHQRIPGNILLALTERVYELPKKRPKTEAEKTKAENDKTKTNEEISKADVNKPEREENLKAETKTEEIQANNLKAEDNNAEAEKLKAETDKPNANGKVLNGFVKQETAPSEPSGKLKVS